MWLVFNNDLIELIIVFPWYYLGDETHKVGGGSHSLPRASTTSQDDQQK
jgi:hypothetical protein